MTTLWQEIRYGLRRLACSPGFTIFAVLVLGLSIGAVTAILSVVDATILKRLPVKDTQHLVVAYLTAGRGSSGEIPGKGYDYPGYTDENSSTSFSYRSFEYFRTESHDFSAVFGFAPLGKAWFGRDDVTIGVNGEASLAPGEMVSGGYFSGLGIRPTLGRLITDEDEKTDATVVVMSYDNWSLRFGQSPSVVGQTIIVEGIAYTIVGVGPQGFYGLVEGHPTEFWVPLSKRPGLTCWGVPAKTLDEPYWRGLTVMARLGPDVTRQQARAELEVLFQRSITAGLNLPLKLAELPHLELLPGSNGLSVVGKRLSKLLSILMVMAGAVLLIGCVNLATLLLERAVARKKEIAIRLALGVSRARLMRQLLTESVLLACIGAALGLVLTWWGARVLTVSLADIVQSEGLRVPEPHLDLTILAFAAGVATLTGILFGFAPAWRATGVDVGSALKEGVSPLISEGHGRVRTAKPFLVGQVIVCLVLLVGAGLFLRTLRNLLHQNLGFDPHHLLVFFVSPINKSIMGPNQIDQYLGLQERLETLPGVRSVTSSLLLPIAGGGAIVPVSTLDRAVGPGQITTVRFNLVGPRFFATMGMPLLSGRDVERSDGRASPKIAVVNEAFARRIFGNADPVGRQFRAWSEVVIVGVAGNAKLESLREQPLPSIYLPYAQMPGFGGFNGIHFEIRTAASPVALIPAVRNAVRQSSPDLALGDLGTETQWINRSVAQEQLFLQLASAFALLALVLVLIGLAGSLSYMVTRHTHDIGIRMAIGASRGQILWMVLQHSLIVAALGIAIGVPASLGVTRLIAHYLYGVEPTDPLTIGAAAMLLVFVALIAGFVPARRASWVDPAEALRCE